MHDFNIDDLTVSGESKRLISTGMPERRVEEAPVEEIPPFTPAQIAFIEKMMEQTIKRLTVSVDVTEENSYSWYSNNEYFRIGVTLSYNHPDGPYNGEQISEGSDSLTVHIPSSNDNP